MNELNSTPSSVSPETVRIAGQPLVFYWNAARLPALIVATIDAVLIIANLQNVYLWGVHLLLFIGLTIWLKLDGHFSFGSSVTLCATAGLLTGAGVAVFRLIWERKLYLVFNLITEPLLTAAGGFILASLIVAILQSRVFSRRKSAQPAPAPQSRRGVNHHA
jgi:hypothetical protein